MARGFGMTALRAALGGVAGGLEGLGAMREQQRLAQEQERERKRQEQLDARQAMMDRVTLQDKGYAPTEDRARLRSGAREAVFRTVFGPPEQRQADDARKVDLALSAASPTQSVDFGGVRYEREDPRALALREATGEQAREKNKELTARAERSAKLNAAVAAFEATGASKQDVAKFRALMQTDPGLQGVLASRFFPAPERPDRKVELSDEEEEMAGRAFLAANARNQKLASALSAAFAQDPAMAQRPGQTAYRLMKRGVVPKMSAATKGYEPPKAQSGGIDLSKLGVDVDASGKLIETPTAQQPARPAAAQQMTPDEWMDANPQRDDEDDAAYLARARAGVATSRKP